MLPHHYFKQVFTDTCLVNCWGTLHEMGHQHQNGWTFYDSSEVTNNVLVLICYSYYSAVSYYRTVGQDGSFGIPDHGGGWDFLGHGYASVKERGELHHWNTMLTAFGPKKLREFIHADAHQMYYDRNTYGRYQTWVLLAGKIFGYDFRKCMEYHGWGLPQEGAYVKVLEDMHLKPWYPVVNAFQTGYDVDGTLVETARPLRIPYGRKYRFNFNTCTKSREGQGSFEIVELKPGLGKWEKIENGVYDYTPVSDPSIVDEWRLVYHETTTDQTTVSYGRLKLIITGNEFDRYADINPGSGSIIDAYRMTKGRQPSASGTGTGMRISSASGRYVTVSRGTIVPTQSGNYTFYAAPDEQALLYLSRRPLALDPDIDQKYRTLIDTAGWHTSYDVNKGSDWHILEAGREYYYCFVLYNSEGGGSGKIGYRINSTGNIQDFPDNRVVFNGITAKQLAEFQDDWVPQEFEDLKGMDVFTGNLWLKPVVSEVIAPQEQAGRSTNNLVDDNGGTIYVTKWDPADQAAPFPQNFEVRFWTKTSFDYLTLQGCGDKPVQTSNLTVRCDDKILYDGPYDSRNGEWRVDYPYMMNCSSVQFSFSDNSVHWSGDGKTGVCLSNIGLNTWFSAKKALPISHPYFVWHNDWTTSQMGRYYNGIGKHGSAGAYVEFTLSSTVTEFAILGEQWYGDGSDRASVWINGERFSEFTPNLRTKPNFEKLSLRVLFIMRHIKLDSDYTVKIQVESGKVNLVGLLLIESEFANAIVPTKH